MSPAIPMRIAISQLSDAAFRIQNDATTTGLLHCAQLDSAPTAVEYLAIVHTQLAVRVERTLHDSGHHNVSRLGAIMGTQFCRSLCALSVLSAGVVHTQSCHARTWRDVSGSFTVEATFIDVSKGRVRLKRSDSGKTIVVPFKKLSDSDQRFVRREHQKKYRSSKSPKRELRKSVPSKIAVTSNRLKVYGSEPQEPQLIRLNLNMKGKAADEAVSYVVEIDSIEAKGAKLELANGSELTIGKERWIEDERDGNDKIEPGLGMLLEFMPDKRGLRKIDVVTGKVRLKTGGDIRQTTIAKFSNGPVQHRNLSAHGVDIELKVKKQELIVETKQTPDWIRMTDAKGNPHAKVMGWGNMSDGTTTTIEFQFSGDKIPSDAELRIQTRVGAVEKEFPFSAKRLMIKELDPFDTL